MGIVQQLEIKMMEGKALTPSGEADLAAKKAALEAAKAQKLAAKNTAPRGALHKALTDIKTTGQKALKFDMLKTLGISVTIASLLKQSQVFTSSIGSIFQLLGAMIDMFLAPLVRPILIPFLRWMSRKMPDIAAAGQATADYIVNRIFPAVQEIVDSIPDWLRNNAKWIGIALVANLLTGGALRKLAWGIGRPLGAFILSGIGKSFMFIFRNIPWVAKFLAAFTLIHEGIRLVGKYTKKDSENSGGLWSWFTGKSGQPIVDLGGAVLVRKDSKGINSVVSSVNPDINTPISPYMDPAPLLAPLARLLTGNIPTDITGTPQLSASLMSQLTTLNTNPANVREMGMFRTFVEDIIRLSIKDATSKGYSGQFPMGVKGLDQFLLGAYLGRGTGEKQTLQRDIVNPFGQGQQFRLEIHLDRGELMGVNYAQVEINGQRGTGTSGTGRGSYDYDPEGSEGLGRGSWGIGQYSIRGADNTFDPNNLVA